MKRWIHILLLPLLAIAACKKGSELENLAPETKIFVKEINLTGGDRLNSRVDLYWSGTDKDGYLKGFEISFDRIPLSSFPLHKAQTQQTSTSGSGPSMMMKRKIRRRLICASR